MSVVGPTRLIILKSGKYDYGEVELVRPLHLVGPNNVGKTSLIAALQFLYIDDQRHMHFSREMDETRRYYFPDPNSYILFECLTPTGYRVVGVQGLGPLKRYEFRRFSYQGRFDIADFLDEAGKLRQEDEIRELLADRDYRKLEPNQLKAALTGSGENNGVHLGLVPTRDSDAYRRFRRVFSNLLRLAHLSQEDLKWFLYEIYESEFKQKSIDLESGYSSQFEKVKRLADEVRGLQAVADDIRRALRLAAERDEVRGNLPLLYTAIGRAWGEIRAELVELREKLNQQMEQLADRESQAREEHRETEQTMRSLDQQLGTLKRDLNNHEQEKTEFKDYLADIEDAKIANLKTQIEELGYLLKNAVQEPVARVAARMATHEKELTAQRALLEGITRTAATRLKGLCGEADLKQAFRLLNHKVLGLRLGADGLQIDDEIGLQARIRAISERMSDGVYRDGAVTLSLDALDPPHLEEYTDPALIAEKIKVLEETVARDKKTLQAAEEAEKLSSQKKALEQEYEELTEKRRRFSVFRENLAKAREWQKEHDQLEKKSSLCSERLGQLREMQREIDRDRIGIKGRLTQSVTREEKYLEDIRSLQRPDQSWAQGGALQLPASFEEMHALYLELHARQKALDTELGNRLLVIDSRTYGRSRGDSEAETLRILGEELDALAQKEEAAEKLWSGLAAGLQSSIKNMLGDLDRLRGKVEDLNRQLAKVSVSNLQRLRLELDENDQLVPWLKKVIRQEDSPLFASTQDTSEAYGCIGEFLRKSGRIELRQLFELKFVVTTADGKEREYPKLESIESNGTTITIKVLINLMLLRGLLDNRKEVSIPYYLDEASSLDQDNASAIVQQSRRLGFTPVLASPEAMDAADNLYFLKDNGGRLILDSCALVRIHREESDETWPD
ncbi:hypothetical protein [Geobacter sp.]|uniref:hypothetical protein n=1 Tax=Geobacter sp. TaxID=46610 RepID=UPI0026183EDE|nr:hypothetical protein [Geobacter sp.]